MFRIAFRQLGIRAKFILLFYTLILLSTLIIGWFGYSHASKAYRDKAEQLDANYVFEIAEKMESFFTKMSGDLQFLSGYYAIERYLYWQDLGDARKRDYWRVIARDTFRDFINSRDYYFKARYLDNAGHEQIKTYVDQHTGKIVFDKDSALEDQQDSDYFQHTSVLDKGHLYVSDLEINHHHEHAHIENNYVPVIRYATPLIGRNNVRYGVIVLDIFADAFLSFIHEAMEHSQHKLYLIDKRGAYLFHPDMEKSFGHVLKHSANFSRDFPNLFTQIGKFRQNTLFEQGNIVSYQRIYPNLEDKKNYWILLGMVDEQQALASLTSFEYVFISLIFITLFLVMLVSRHFVGGLVQPLRFATAQFERLAQGEVIRERIDYKAEDEIRQMLNSADQLFANMEAVACRADAIAEGDFSGDVQVLSVDDRLGHALNNMTSMLRENRERNTQQNWLKDGIGNLNQALSGSLSPQQLADKALSVIGRYLGAGRGVFYVYQADEKTLHLLGSYMYTERAHIGSQFGLGEGAIGQVALEKQPIILRGLQTKDKTPITTGTLSHSPLYTYTYPLLRDGELQGVIELAGFERFSDIQQVFLQNATDVVATFLYVVLQRQQIESLLSSTEQARNEAQAQSRKIQAVNRQMEEQQQRLQQQTEALQVANAQMEEQQQQLQQQTHALQLSNTQMEEQQQQLQQQALVLKHKNTDLEISKEALNKKAKELSEASQYKSEFLANMSHELRTPLNSIILLSKMLMLNEKQHLSTEEEKRAKVIHQAGEELLRLINDILDLSKIEAGKMALQIEPVPYQTLIDACHDLFDDVAAQAKLQFITENQRSEAHLLTDEHKMIQVLRNLLANAFKFTKQGSVNLIISDSGREDLPISIAVKDTGIGIPQDKQQQIFEAFQQVDGSVSREFGGTGLGLAISLRFIQLLGGTISLSSREGQGSCFNILLPATQIEEEASNLVKTAEVEPLDEAEDDREDISINDAVILLIEDDPNFAKSVFLLNRKLGYKTLVAKDGKTGLYIAKTYQPHGILLDLGLPDMDGYEVLKELKATQELRHIPVYIISGRDEEAHPLQADIVGYLQKPIAYEQLADAELFVIEQANLENQVLLIEGKDLSLARLAELTQGKPVKLAAAMDLKTAIATLDSIFAAVVVIDINREQQDCIDICQALKQRYPSLPLILYAEHNPSTEILQRLKTHCDRIVINLPKNKQDLLDNIAHFLKKVLKTRHDNDRSLAKNLNKTKTPSLEGKHLLVVDDDPRNLFVTTSVLEQAGAQVDNALDGEKALVFLRSGAQVDAIFMDIMMPGIDGYETIRAIKADPKLSHIPIIALTAKALTTDKKQALAAGADDYLSKPVYYEVLINTAKVWCEH